MSVPAVNITIKDGQTGVQPAISGLPLAVVGVSSQGTVDLPSTFGRVKDLVDTFGDGPGVEAAAHFIQRYGKPVVFVRTGQTTAGTAGDLDVTGVSGTSVATLTGGTDPIDDYDVVFEVLTGGTIGTAGIEYRLSHDGGRTFGGKKPLGTATSLAIAGADGLDFAAGTLVAGDVVTYRTEAPAPNSTELGAALVTLKETKIKFSMVHVATAIDGTLFDTVDTNVAGFLTNGKPIGSAWAGNTRMPDVGESDATYQTAISAIFAAKETTYGNLCSGAQEMISAVSNRKYRRPVSFAVAAREASQPEYVHIADVNLGSMPCDIRDTNGNPKHHDEWINPGLDDARFTVLRTFPGDVEGVYVNRSRCFSATGSDFFLFTYRRVINIAMAVLNSYFTRRLHKPVQVDANTGYLTDAEREEIQQGAQGVLEAALRSQPAVSGITFALSRYDNVLSTRTLSGDLELIPLAYPDTINLTAGFTNPALQTL